MLRFLRFQRPINDTEIQDLLNKFELKAPISHGVPRNAHKLAVDNILGLVAVITKQGYLELYEENGNKRILLRKLGSSCSYFDFVEGEGLLLAVCPANLSSGLPEAYHLIDTNGVNPCSTTCRSNYLPQAKCFCLIELPDGRRKCLITGHSNGSVYYAELKKNIDHLEFIELVSIPELLPDLDAAGRFKEFSHLKASRDIVFCCFQSSFIVIICLKTRQLLKTIDLPSKFTTISINEALQSAYFISSELCCSLSLQDLSAYSSKLTTRSFERTSFHQVIVSARTDKPIVLFSSGIPGCAIRRQGSLTLATEEETLVFSLSSELLDARVVYEGGPNELEKKRATAVILLCEHEIIAVDLMDEDFKCMPLNFLQCVDSSSITTIQLATVSNKEMLHSSNSTQYSSRRELFDRNGKRHSDNEPRSLIFTGHQSGDILVWDLTNGGQHLLQVFKATNYLRTGEGECLDDDDFPEEYEIETDEEFEFEQVDHHELNRKERPNFLDWLGSPPAKLWRNSKTKRIQEIGLYDDRCEDDRLAVESFCYCNQLDLLACGLYGGQILVASTSRETNSTSYIEKLNFVNARLSDVSDLPSVQDPIRLQDPSRWFKSIFKPNPHILCILPQTPIRTISISPTTGLIAAGCSTGIVVFDPSSGRIVFFKNFLNAQGTELVLAGEKPLSRLKTMKQTVRKTFRGRSIRMSKSGHRRPVERQIEFRDTKQPASNGVRTVCFYENSDERNFLFAGTSNVIYMFELEGSDTCYLYKEIRLSHHAPAINISLVKLENQTRMFVFTEEQVRCFIVENLRSARYSYKLTAKHGIRIKQANVCSSNGGAPYLGMICNDGALIGMSSTDTRVRTSKQVIKSDDAIGVRLSTIDDTGQVAFVGHGGSSLTLFATANH